MTRKIKKSMKKTRKVKKSRKIACKNTKCGSCKTGCKPAYCSGPKSSKNWCVCNMKRTKCNKYKHTKKKIQ